MLRIGRKTESLTSGRGRNERRSAVFTMLTKDQIGFLRRYRSNVLPEK
jgi:hypothetical protein